MKIAQWNYLGPRSTPQEVRDLRKASFDYHRTLGQAVVHKHRWNLKDVRDGKAIACPFHDETLDEGEFDPYCFGTGILGGWDDGVITFMSIADTQQDSIKVSKEGVLLLETHPAFTAPWIPEMGDQDIIITADFALDTWDIVNEFARYELQEVTPKTMRGFRSHQRGYKVHQQGNLDKLPYGDFRYDIPIVFDYSQVPAAPAVPPGADPDDYPDVPVGASLSFHSQAVRITGEEAIVGPESDYVQDVAITGKGTSTTKSTDVRIGGTTPGAHVIF